MMPTTDQEYVRNGNLLKCPQNSLNPFKHKWQSRFFVLFSNSEHGRVRIEYYDNEKNWQQEKGRRIIPLSNCVSIKPVRNKEYQHVIEIIIQDKTIQLAASTKEYERSWFKDLCGTVFGNSNLSSIVQVVGKPIGLDLSYHLDHGDISNPNSPRILHKVLENPLEDVCSGEEHSIGSSSATLNDSTSVDGSRDFKENGQIPFNSSVASELSSLVSFESGFCDGSSVASTVTEATSYPVTIRPTLASQKAGMTGTYLLQINTMNITLIDIPNQKPVCLWPILYLRRYGRGRTKFSFEASEKCQYGKGVYTFNTLEGDTIFHVVDLHARGISTRNQMIKKRTSMPEGFKPLGSASHKLTHSEGKILDKLRCPDDDEGPQACNFADSTNDIVSIGPGDSVSQMGTLRKDLPVVEEGNGLELKIDNNDLLKERVLKVERGMSIGSGISLEIAQNISQTIDDPKDVKKSHHDDEPIESSPELDRAVTVSNGYNNHDKREHKNKLNVSTIEEETLAETLAIEKTAFIHDLDRMNAEAAQHNRTSTPTTEETTNKKGKQVKRSSSLKLPSSLRRSNSTKDSSIKKSQSVKRSNSFRMRFFKSKTSESKSAEEKIDEQVTKYEKKYPENSDNDSIKSVPRLEDIDIKIANQEKVKDYLARAIEDDMNRLDLLEDGLANIEIEPSKTRRRPVRHKSNEMTANGPEPARKTPCRISNSFAGYDYRSKERIEQEFTDNEVMRKVELYEGLKKQADDSRVSSYTFWRRKLTIKDGKGKTTPDTSSINSTQSFS